MQNLETVMYLAALCVVGGLMGAIYGYRPTGDVLTNWIIWSLFLMGCSFTIGVVSWKAAMRRGETEETKTKAVWDVFFVTGGIFLSVLFGYVAVESFETDSELRWKVIFSAIAVTSSGMLAYGFVRLTKNLLTILDGDVTSDTLR